MLDPIVEQDAGRLVVMVKSTFSGSAKTGAGIIFGYQKDALYIATANHNVRWGAKPPTRWASRLHLASVRRWRLRLKSSPTITAALTLTWRFSESEWAM